MNIGNVVTSKMLIKRWNLQFKAPYGVLEKYITARNFGFGVFFKKNYDRIYNSS